MNFLIGFFFYAFAILFAALPFVACFFCFNAAVFDSANYLRNRRGLAPRPKPWVFKTREAAYLAAALSFCAFIALEDWSDLGSKFLLQSLIKSLI